MLNTERSASDVCISIVLTTCNTDDDDNDDNDHNDDDDHNGNDMRQR